MGKVSKHHEQDSREKSMAELKWPTWEKACELFEKENVLKSEREWELFRHPQIIQVVMGWVEVTQIILHPELLPAQLWDALSLA